MPELPEVETIARDLRRHGIVGRVIQSVRVHWARTVSGHAPRAFSAALTGACITGIGRRAKYLVFQLDGGRALLVHLRMTGRFELSTVSAPAGQHERVALDLDDGRSLRFLDSRKFGRWILTERPAAIFSRLGPEPLEKTFGVAGFVERLVTHRRQLKPLLLDQSFVAGLGNIYVDEALWEARLHPRRLASRLTPDEAVRLHAAIRAVLKRGIANAGTSLGAGRANFYSVAGRQGRNQDGLKVFRRTGQRCPRCGGEIRRTVVGQRGTHLCPVCQRSAVG